MNRDYVEDCYHITPRVIVKGMDERRADIRFWTERENGALSLFAAVPNSEPQGIEVEEFSSPALDRLYFLCECCRRVFKLYLPIGCMQFKCRQCHKLRYRLTSFNPNTMHGRAQYRASRLHKLANERMRIRTPIYQGKYTKRFQRFLRLCGRAGLTDIVHDAKRLMETIHAPQPAPKI